MCTHTHMKIYEPIYIHTYKYTSIHMHTHAHTHTHTHTHTSILQQTSSVSAISILKMISYVKLSRCSKTSV